MTAKPSHTDHGTEYWGIERVKHLEEECRHWEASHRLVCAELAEREEKAAAWDALVALLPLLGEWHRGAVLAADGRLLDWVRRNTPAGARSGARENARQRPPDAPGATEGL